MHEGERIRELRRSLGLTQARFGNQTGVVQGHLTNIENGIRSVTKKTRKVICATYRVNEEWLKTGNGDMFLPPSNDDALAALISEYNLGSFANDVIRAYFRLSDRQRGAIYRYISSVVEDSKKADQMKDG